jgi:hypothetical protein
MFAALCDERLQCYAGSSHDAPDAHPWLQPTARQVVSAVWGAYKRRGRPAPGLLWGLCRAPR